MKVLVIPDIHLKAWIFDRAADVLRAGKADRAVCLMDMADDWDMEFQVERYRAIYDRAMAFAKEFPDTLWCYGNHDVSYPWGKLESGYSPYAESTVITKLRELEASLKDSSQIAFLHRIDKVLFSHGGLCTAFVDRLDPRLLIADMDEVVAAVNQASPKLLWDDISPLWLRPQYDVFDGKLGVYREVEMFRDDSFVQVVGHTPVEIIREKNGVISTDVFSTYRNGRQIGESAMIVIDTESGAFEKVEVVK